jgi:hypothetical protein
MKNFTNGDSFEFINRRYTRGKERLQIGDEVIIHPVKAGLLEKAFYTSGFKSQATKSYPAKIVAKEIRWVGIPKDELCLEGINENKNWHRAVLNEYGFNRLEFVKRNA